MSDHNPLTTPAAHARRLSPARHSSVALVLLAALAVAAAGCRGGDDVPTVAPVESAEQAEAADPNAPPDPAEPEAEPSADVEPSDGEQAAAEAQPTPARPAPPVEAPQIRQRRADIEANRELATRLGLAPPDPLLVSDLMTRADVRELTGFQGELLETSLDGIPPGPSYNAIRLQADGGFGFALQLWVFDEPRIQSAQFRRLRDTYFDAQSETSGVGNEAFAAIFHGIFHYAFLHRASRSVAVVTCESRLCDGAQIRALAQRVANRL